MAILVESAILSLGIFRKNNYRHAKYYSSQQEKLSRPPDLRKLWQISVPLEGREVEDH